MSFVDNWSNFLCDYCTFLCFNGSFYCALTILSLISLLVLYGLWKYKEGPRYNKPNRIDDKVVIITGCNTGIGKETALEMAKRGARVYMACRDGYKCEQARQEIIKVSGNKNVFKCTLDLASLQSVREFAAQFHEQEERLDILINNAGIMATPRNLTVDGYESQFAVNHLGHFLLTNLLLDKLKASAPSRIVVVSSFAYVLGRIKKDDINSEKSYNAFLSYGQSKLANVLFTHHLAGLLRDSEVTVNCLHPGSVQTELFRNNDFLGIGSNIIKFGLRSVKGGAQTSIYLALDPELKDKSGGYYERMKKNWVLPKARDNEMAAWLWNKSEEMVGLKK